MVGKLAALFLGEGARALVLLDGDKAGHDGRTSLARDLYKGHESAVLLLDEAMGGEELEIEDLVGAAAFVTAVNAALRLELVVAEEDDPRGSAVKRALAAAKRSGVELPDGWKVSATLRLVGDWAEGRQTCPKEAIERAAVLFDVIRERLASLRL